MSQYPKQKLAQPKQQPRQQHQVQQQQHNPQFALNHAFPDPNYPVPGSPQHIRHHSAPLVQDYDDSIKSSNNGVPVWNQLYDPYGMPLLQQQQSFQLQSSTASRESFMIYQQQMQMQQPPRTAQSELSSVATAFSSAAHLAVPTTEGEKDQYIRVCVRVRPLSELEKSREDVSAVTVFADRQTLQLPSQDGAPPKPMTFHIVEDATISQDQVFRECGVVDLMNQALNGFATTAFAFGQTGSGKTFTMTGPDSSPSGQSSDMQGIIPRSLEYIFSSAKQAGDRCTIRAAYLEIFTTRRGIEFIQVRDLLNPGASNLAVRYNQEKGFYVENLFVVECESLDDSLAVLEEGLRNRRSAAHALNEHSSRSHSVMTLYIDSETVDPDDGRPVRKNGKISFVDLAGSERVKETKAVGEVLTEAHSINKSLLTLGKCISALADPKKRVGHIPYRDSKLTKLLSDSLGGTGLALMIACISPSSYNIAETMKTLRYASRAKKIKNKPVVQMDHREELIMQLKRQLKMAQNENAILRNVLGHERSQSALSRLGAPEVEQKAQGRRTPQLQGGTPTPTSFPPLAVGNYTPVARVSAAAPSSSVAVQRESDQLKSLVQEYAKETDNLKCEITELLQSKQRSDHSYTTLMRENELLQDQVSDLETRLVQANGIIPASAPGTPATIAAEGSIENAEIALAGSAQPVKQSYLLRTPSSGPSVSSSPARAAAATTTPRSSVAPSTPATPGAARPLKTINEVTAVNEQLKKEVGQLDQQIRTFQQQ